MCMAFATIQGQLGLPSEDDLTSSYDHFQRAQTIVSRILGDGEARIQVGWMCFLMDRPPSSYTKVLYHQYPSSLPNGGTQYKEDRNQPS
ncbi:hypothetical protein IFM47457_01665 [Aspergillus lentulus]|nr:hypothetical protein IFM47457_01665 [Aspergillus lentulus]